MRSLDRAPVASYPGRITYLQPTKRRRDVRFDQRKAWAAGAGGGVWPEVEV